MKFVTYIGQQPYQEKSNSQFLINKLGLAMKTRTAQDSKKKAQIGITKFPGYCETYPNDVE